ncbi:MAG: hypothetical protein DA408_11280 [Bacteroidetes bacterium]|nr:MAG: hypothetical protein C7N36_14140 [Bacteroidota bacterium]PTM12257.1 MAG: hypothetical protein DA408_11280 [Bacteroidota bacterium]
MNTLNSLFEKNRSSVPLLFLLVAATLLRTIGLGQENFWLDEATSIETAHLGIKNIIATSQANDVHPPLYYILLHFWLNAFGTSEVVARLFSAIFSIITIPVFYRFTLRLFDHKTALIATSLLTFSPFAIFYAQEARSYSLFALCILASFVYFYKCINSTNKHFFPIAGFIFWSTLMLFLHIYGLFFLFSQFIVFAYWLYVNKRITQWHPLWAAFIISGLVFCLWVPSLYTQTQVVVTKGYWIPSATLGYLLYTFFEIAGDYRISRLVSLLFLGIFIYGGKTYLVHVIRQITNEPFISILVGCWAFVPIVVAFSVSQIAPSILLARPLIASAMPLFILTAVLLQNISNKQLKTWSLIFICTLFMVLNGKRYLYLEKEDWRSIAAIIDHPAAPKADAIVLHEYFCNTPLNYYYSGNLPFIDLPPRGTGLQISSTNIQQIVDKNMDAFWLVVSHTRHPESWIVAQFTQQGYHLAAEHKLIGVECFLLSRSQ